MKATISQEHIIAGAHDAMREACIIQKCLGEDHTSTCLLAQRAIVLAARYATSRAKAKAALARYDKSPHV